MKKTFITGYAVKDAKAFRKKLRRLKFSQAINKTIEKTIRIRATSGLIRWLKEEKYLEGSTMEEIATEIDLTKEELSFYFNDFVGCRFLTWRKMLRIRHAEEMLEKDRSLNNRQLAEAVGIIDKHNFRSQFKEVTGTYPSEWKTGEK